MCPTINQGQETQNKSDITIGYSTLNLLLDGNGLITSSLGNTALINYLMETKIL